MLEVADAVVTENLNLRHLCNGTSAMSGVARVHDGFSDVIVMLDVAQTRGLLWQKGSENVTPS